MRAANQSENTAWSDGLLNDKRHLADPAADAILDRMINEKGHEAAMKFFDELIRNIDLPLQMLSSEDKSVIESMHRLPAWADRSKIKLGEALFIDHGPKFLVFLYFKSLPLLYSMANGAEVLTATGRLAHNGDSMTIFSRRIAETGQFLLDVMCPGGIVDSGTGISSVVKVRLIHASIRKFLKDENWDESKLGKPINQEDMAATLMTFSISMIDALEQFGVQSPKEMQEGYLHNWKVIGTLLGIEEDLLPSNVEDGRKLLSRILSRQSARSEAGVLLTQALVGFSKQNFRSGVIQNVPKALIRHLVGPKFAEILEVQPRFLWLYDLLPIVLRRLFNWIERLEDHSKPLNLIIDELSVVVVREMVNYFDRYKGRRFEIPAPLSKRWAV